MPWRLAHSLVELRDEINDLAPGRSRLSDGTLGDPAHAARASRHNPNAAGVVCALDLTHDPANGCDIHAIARRIVRVPHPNLEYVISDDEVAKRKTGFRWEPYRPGDPLRNKHTKHAHFAVGVGPDSDPRPPYDDMTPWLPGLGSDAPQEDDEMLAALSHVAQTYRAIVGREPDPSGHKHWAKQFADAERAGNLDAGVVLHKSLVDALRANG
jgi:hypothetical protein